MVGKLLEGDHLASEESKHTLILAKAAASDSGVPGGINMLYQWAEILEQDGALSQRALARALQWLEYGIEHLDTLDPETLLRTVVQAVRQHAKDKAATKLLETWASGSMPDKAVETYISAAKIGEQQDRGKSASSRSARKAALLEATNFKAMRTGFAELDAGMGGGLTMGCVGGILGGPGDGKSTACIHISAYLTGIQQKFVAYASAELRVYQVAAKYEAALFGVPVLAIRKNPSILDSYYDQHGDNIGPFAVKHFDMPPGKKPTPTDIEHWLREEEARAGRKVDILMVDYGDRFHPSVTKAHGSSYSMGEIVSDELAQMAADRNIPIWTGSATTRRKSGMYWGTGDAADSQHKERRFDAFFSVNALGKTPDRTMTINLFKWREGDAHLVIGPKPVGFAVSRLYETSILDAEDTRYNGLYGNDDQGARLAEK